MIYAQHANAMTSNMLQKTMFFFFKKRPHHHDMCKRSCKKHQKIIKNSPILMIYAEHANAMASDMLQKSIKNKKGPIIMIYA